MIRVLIADDHANVRYGLGMLIAAEPDLEVVGAAADGAEAVSLAQELDPDVVLMDLSMPGTDGVTAMRMIRGAQPQTRLLALTVSGTQTAIREAIRAGADGYLLKESSSAEILEAIRTVDAGGRPMSPAAVRVLNS